MTKQHLYVYRVWCTKKILNTTKLSKTKKNVCTVDMADHMSIGWYLVSDQKTIYLHKFE